MTSTICAEYSTHTDRPPIGPCVLRPGHRGHIHQDMRGIQWANQLEPAEDYPIEAEARRTLIELRAALAEQ
ncbi:hypothetical protein [Streptomyces sp. NPDC047985]|uniref:hypothetical protein n=1 Tax=Streptomyces sp. NPDC047985 TaxID=3155384 RepID=UPI003437DC1D